MKTIEAHLEFNVKTKEFDLISDDELINSITPKKYAELTELACKAFCIDLQNSSDYSKQIETFIISKILSP